MEARELQDIKIALSEVKQNQQAASVSRADGFHAITSRIDKLNGSVLSNTLRSNKNEIMIAEQAKTYKVIMWALGIEGMMLAAVITLIVLLV